MNNWVGEAVSMKTSIELRLASREGHWRTATTAVFPSYIAVAGWGRVGQARASATSYLWNDGVQ